MQLREACGVFAGDIAQWYVTLGFLLTARQVAVSWNSNIVATNALLSRRCQDTLARVFTRPPQNAPNSLSAKISYTSITTCLRMDRRPRERSASPSRP